LHAEVFGELPVVVPPIIAADIPMISGLTRASGVSTTALVYRAPASSLRVSSAFSA